jgi:hypothetical protein
MIRCNAPGVQNFHFAITSLIYSPPFCETKKTTDYTDSTDRNRTVPKIRAIRVIRGLNSGFHNVVTTVDGFVNNSGLHPIGQRKDLTPAARYGGQVALRATPRQGRNQENQPPGYPGGWFS